MYPGMWYPPEMWEAHGFPYEAYTARGGWVPASDVVCERFCAACACSQRSDEDEPCWNCGGVTQHIKPLFWPVTSSQQNVVGGNTFGVDELEKHEAHVLVRRDIG